MPTVQEIEFAAAGLRRANRRVSVRNVRDVLPRGGSHSDIGPPLAAWKANANYRPKALPKEIPAGLAPVIEEFAARLWAVARDEAETVVEARMKQQAELERVYEVEAEIAWAEADRLTDEVARLRGLLREAGGDVGPMLPPMPSLEARARIRATRSETDASPDRDERDAAKPGLLDRIGEKAAAVVGEGALTADEILTRLGNFRHDGGKPVTAKTLAPMLDHLAKQARHVRKLDDGRYAALRPVESQPRKRPRRDPAVEAALEPVEAGWGWRPLLADGITSRKFWDGLLRQAAVVIEVSGREALSAEEILDGLPDPLLRKANDFEPLTLSVLREKLAFRASRDKYVVRRKDGLFALKPPA